MSSDLMRLIYGDMRCDHDVPLAEHCEECNPPLRPCSRHRFSSNISEMADCPDCYVRGID